MNPKDRNEGPVQGELQDGGQLVSDPWRDVGYKMDRMTGMSQRMAQANFGRSARVMLVLVQPDDAGDGSPRVHAAATINRADAIHILSELTERLQHDGAAVRDGMDDRYRLVANDD